MMQTQHPHPWWERNRKWLIVLCGALLLLASCVPAPLLRPMSRPVSPSTQPASLPTAPCGPHLAALPKSVRLTHQGHPGVWVAEERYRCLVVRQRVALACKSACEDRVIRTVAGYAQAQETILKTCEDRERQYQQKAREQEVWRWISVGIAGVVGIVIGGVGGGAAGFALGVGR